MFRISWSDVWNYLRTLCVPVFWSAFKPRSGRTGKPWFHSGFLGNRLITKNGLKQEAAALDLADSFYIQKKARLLGSSKLSA